MTGHAPRTVCEAVESQFPIRLQKKLCILWFRILLIFQSAQKGHIGACFRSDISSYPPFHICTKMDRQNEANYFQCMLKHTRKQHQKVLTTPQLILSFYCFPFYCLQHKLLYVSWLLANTKQLKQKGSLCFLGFKTQRLSHRKKKH